MTTLALQLPPAYHAVVSRAAGPEADVVTDRIGQVQHELNSSFTVSRNRRESERRLAEALRDATGADAAAIAGTIAAARVAKAFLEVLPDGVQAPEIDVASDGEVHFEWIFSRGNRLLISFSRLGELNFASIHPAGELKGREYFAGLVPPTIAFALSRVLG